MQKMQKTFAFPTQNEENVPKAVTVHLFQIFLHVSYEKTAFSTFFLTFSPAQSSGGKEFYWSLECRKDMKPRESGTFVDFSALFL